jgi:hypothetical protein
MLASAGGLEAAAHWWVVEGRIPSQQWVEVTVRGVRVDTNGSDTNG